MKKQRKGRNNMNKKAFTYEQFEIIFKLVYFLNLTDIMMTLALVQTGLFKEANPIMAPIVQHPYLAVMIKAIVPLFVIVYTLWRVRCSEWDLKMAKFLKIGSYSCFAFYLIVNLMHLFYTIMYFVL